jgi:hypothetical protein
MNNLPNRVIDLAVQIQQISAPTFAEGPRGEFVRDLFLKEKLKDVSMDSLGNVYARLAGRQKKARPLIVSAHLDTVFPASVNLQVKKDAEKIVAPGIGDNSLGVSALFGILWFLRERKIELPHDVWFVANVGEEGLGDLRGMRVWDFDRINLILFLEDSRLGYIIVHHSPLYHSKTAGGHSWSDYGSLTCKAGFLPQFLYCRATAHHDERRHVRRRTGIVLRRSKCELACARKIQKFLGGWPFKRRNYSKRRIVKA